MVKISIIIPAYNPDENLLARCINSIIKQNYCAYEIILVNDGSNASFQGVFEKIDQLDQRIKVVNKENGGASSARNFGLNYVVGEYVTFVDADDQVTPYFFLVFEKLIQQYDLSVMIAGNTTNNMPTPFYNAKQLLKVEIRSGEIKNNLICNMMSDLIQFNGGYIGRGPWSRIIKSDIAKNNRFDETLVFGEDICWNIELIRNVDKIGVIYIPLYIYSVINTSITSQFSPQLLKRAESGIIGIRKRIDLNNKEQFEAYMKRCFEEIERVYRCTYYANENEAKVLEKHIYEDEAWNDIINEFWLKTASIKMILKLVLYKTKLLFLYYHIKYKKLKERNK